MSTNDFPDIPQGINPRVPNVARIYDYLLGGKENFAADREAAEQLIKVVPDVRQRVVENRAFLRRTVRFLAESGVRQFLDIGSGLPTAENVHEIVHRVNPNARVVYVDSDEVPVVHGRALLAKNPGQVRMVHADVRHIDALLNHPDIVDFFDREQPIAVIMIALLHFVPGDTPHQIVRAVREWLPPDSYLVLSHVCPGDMSEEEQRGVISIYERANMRIVIRSREEVLRLFDGFQLTEEGLVPVSEWRPDDQFRTPPPRGGHFAGGVGRLLDSSGAGSSPTA